jgi:hypothetical protein
MLATSCTGHGKNEQNFLLAFPLHAIPNSLQWLLLFGVEGGEMYVVGTGCRSNIFVNRVRSYPDSSSCLVAKRVRH